MASNRQANGMSRRDILRAGGLGLLGLSTAALHRRAAAADSAAAASAAADSAGIDHAFGRARSCIVFFLTGGPPQHETWDPKPDAPPEIRGELGQIASAVPGLCVGELMPRVAQIANRCCVLRAVATADSAHSSSGYWMLTGYPHQPLNTESARPGAPNDWPGLGAVVRRLRNGSGHLPSAVTLPERIINNPNIPWPGQDGGFLGRNVDPWLLTCDPAEPNFRIPELSLPDDLPVGRFDGRRSLLARVNTQLAEVEAAGAAARYDVQSLQVFDLLRSPPVRRAFDLDAEPRAMRDRYGRTKVCQSVLLARRLVEAGVPFVQINWPREPGDTSSSNPLWDTHQHNAERLRTVLMPQFDRCYSALLEDLAQRGLLEQTLVVLTGEFGRTPRINGGGGRDHWGNVFSVVLAGGGVRGGVVHGASDAIGGYPRDGRVLPQDLTATILHCLGIDIHAEIRDAFGRPVAVTRGEVIRQAF
jgi:hypothetical protein